MSNKIQTRAALVDCVERMTGDGNNALDVLIQLALFTPSKAFPKARANSAGTKVIYTDSRGRQHTRWADDWTIPKRRAETIEALRDIEATP